MRALGRAAPAALLLALLFDAAPAQECGLTATPRIRTIQNAASYEERPIAANTLISVYGSNFQAPGGVRVVTQDDLDANGNRFPNELACIAVEIAGRRAPILYVQVDQVNIQVPTMGDLGPVPVVVIANPGRPNELRSQAFHIEMAAASPGLFRFFPTPCVAARFPDGTPAADPTLVPGVGARKPAVGDIVSIYATGLGLTEPIFQAGEVTPLEAVHLRDQVTVELEGVAMDPEDVLYAGLTPGSITGLIQVNIRIAATARRNAENRIRVRIGGFASQGTAVTIPIAP